MRNLFCFLTVVSIAASSLGQQLQYIPYRKVDGKYYSLQPVYDWLTSVRARVANREEIPLTEIINRPMKEWYGLTEPFQGVLVQYKVTAVLSDGLLAREARFTPVNGWIEDSPFFLKNYPGFSRFTDDEEIPEFLALRTGSYQYNGRTVPEYDCGVPYDPWALARAKADASSSTNANK